MNKAKAVKVHCWFAVTQMFIETSALAQEIEKKTAIAQW